MVQGAVQFIQAKVTWPSSHNASTEKQSHMACQLSLESRMPQFPKQRGTMSAGFRMRRRISRFTLEWAAMTFWSLATMVARVSKKVRAESKH